MSPSQSVPALIRSVDTGHGVCEHQINTGPRSRGNRHSEGSQSSVRKLTRRSNSFPINDPPRSPWSSDLDSDTPYLHNLQQRHSVHRQRSSADNDHEPFEFGHFYPIIAKRPCRASRESVSHTACCVPEEARHVRWSSGRMSLPPLESWATRNGPFAVTPTVRKCSTIDTIRATPAEPVTTHTHARSVAVSQRLPDRLPASDEGSHHVTFQMFRSGTSVYEVMWKENVSEGTDGSGHWSPGISRGTRSPTKSGPPRIGKASTNQRNSLSLVDSKLAEWSWSGDASGSLRLRDHSSEGYPGGGRRYQGSGSVSYDVTPILTVPPNSERHSQRSSKRATSTESPQTSESSVTDHKLKGYRHGSTVPASDLRSTLSTNTGRPPYEQHFTGHKDSISLLRAQARRSSTQLSYPSISSTLINDPNSPRSGSKLVGSRPPTQGLRRSSADQSLRQLLRGLRRAGSKSEPPMLAPILGAKPAPITISSVPRSTGVSNRPVGSDGSPRKGVHFRESVL
ncbi:hypothetical protein P152DRAFT_512140 [Eremomyces bilateralis CBS 781.70]|uniref:Uncharacterized protein n=1 Tax=Eremomyces bilateralis CBS 781.70 TaxID=1392243 RepID=A0A6G1G9S8_9PEZI|nr:uncharacterized protein P152DRAFT_512140 [Eremomyces bilateralis CBS 781.70]KAF1814783.1 hypothetical protein P152DRAFT_512140 [Eremomyces bilateralis CBS 781.70]